MKTLLVSSKIKWSQILLSTCTEYLGMYTFFSSQLPFCRHTPYRIKYTLQDKIHKVKVVLWNVCTCMRWKSQTDNSVLYNGCVYMCIDVGVTSIRDFPPSDRLKCTLFQRSDKTWRFLSFPFFNISRQTRMFRQKR